MLTKKKDQLTKGEKMLSTMDSILNNYVDFVHIGVDLAKKVFQVAYQDPITKRLVYRQFERGRTKILD